MLLPLGWLFIRLNRYWHFILPPPPLPYELSVKSHFVLRAFPGIDHMSTNVCELESSANKCPITYCPCRGMSDFYRHGFPIYQTCIAHLSRTESPVGFSVATSRESSPRRFTTRRDWKRSQAAKLIITHDVKAMPLKLMTMSLAWISECDLMFLVGRELDKWIQDWGMCSCVDRLYGSEVTGRRSIIVPASYIHVSDVGLAR